MVESQSNVDAAQPRSANVAAAPVLSFDEALAFLLSLPQELSVGVDQVLAVQRLLARLAEHGQPATAAVLRGSVGPILCRNPSQQQLFGERFDAWLKERHALPVVLTSPRPPVPSREVAGLRRRRWLWWGEGAVLAGFAVMLALRELRPQPLPVAPNQQPGSAAEAPPSAPPTNPRPELRPLRLRPSLQFEEHPLPLSELPWGSVVLPLLAAGIVWHRLRVWLEARRFLARDPGAVPEQLESLVLRLDKERLRDPEWRALANTLRARVPSGESVFDLPATVRATARAAGKYTRVERAGSKLPDYLALIERDSLHDVQANYFDHWLSQLRAQDVNVERYYYRREPLHLQATAGACSLLNLQSTHPGHRLLVLSEGEHFLDPLSGVPRAWLQQLDSWQHRALLTPAPAPNWSARERAFEQAGLTILPATSRGFAQSRGAPAPIAARDELGLSAPLPRWLVEHARRWLAPDAPDADTQQRLLAELRAYLNADQYYWLVACALYPQLRLGLVAGLGSLLRGREGVPLFDFAGLVRIARLPWLRAAYFPDWLRTALLRSLASNQLRELRAALRQLLIATLRQGETRLELELGRADQGFFREVWRQLARRLRKQSTQPDATARDRVFLRWMDDGFGLRSPRTLLRGLGGALRAGPEDDAWPPHWVLRAFGIALQFGVLAAAVRILMKYVPDAIHGSLLLLYFVPAVLAALRWSQPRAAGVPRARRQMLFDACTCFVPAGELALENEGRTPFWVHPQSGVAVALDQRFLVIGAVGAASLWVWSTLRQRSAGDPNGFASRLGRVAEALMPDRYLGRLQAPSQRLDPPSWATALMALAVAPCTLGWGVPLYLLILPVRYLHLQRERDWRKRMPWRANLEALLCLVPLLPVSLHDHQYWSLYVFWTGFVSFRDRALQQQPQERQRRSWLYRLNAALGRWAPDRWVALRPAWLPLCALAAGLCGFVAWLHDTSFAVAVFPVERAVTQAVVLKADMWTQVDLSPDGRRAVIGSKRSYVIDTDGTGTPIALGDESGLATAVRFGPDGQHVLTTSGRDGARVWMVGGQRATEVATYPIGNAVTSSAISPDGRSVVEGSSDGSLQLWNPNASSPLVLAEARGQRVVSASFSPDSKRVLAVWQSGDVGIQPVDAPGEGMLIATQSAVAAASFTAEGEHVVIARTDGRIEIDGVLHAGEPSQLLNSGLGTIAAFSIDGGYLVTASNDERIRVWKTDGTAEPVSVLEQAGPVGIVAITPDGRWVVATAREDVAISPEGRLLVAAVPQNTAQIWDTAHGTRAFTLTGHVGGIRSLHLSADGTHLATTDAEAVRIWHLFEPIKPSDSASTSAAPQPWPPAPPALNQSPNPSAPQPRAQPEAGAAEALTPVQQSDSVAALRNKMVALAPERLPSGGQPIGAMLSGWLEEGSSQEAQVQMEPGRCYSVVAEGGSTLRDLDIALVSVVPLAGMSPILAVDNIKGPEAVLGEGKTCFKWAWPIAAPVRVVITANEGRGLFVAQVWAR